MNPNLHCLQKSAPIRRPVGCSLIHQPGNSPQHHGATISALNLLAKSYWSAPSSPKPDNNNIRTAKDDDDAGLYQPKFKQGDRVMVEVIFFGPLGASVDVVAHNTHNAADCIPETEPALGRGMILQKEIAYFRRGRGGVDVVRYEILPAYVEKVRNDVLNEDGEPEERLDISLRPPGGKAKAQELGAQILERLKESDDGVLGVGDKSSPEEIGDMFPGASKGAFKKAVSALYKKGLVTPSANSIALKI